MRAKINRPDSADGKHTDAIRHGVKADRDTQPVQVRMLKAQIKVLKQLASLEDRNASEVIRELVDGYIRYCVMNWPKGEALDILQSTISLAGYHEEHDRELDRIMEWVMTDNGQGSLPADHKYEHLTDDDAK